MADESTADDGAMFDIWASFTLDEIVATFDRLEALYRAAVRLRGAPPTPDMIATARDLVDHGLKLHHVQWLAGLAAS